MGGSHVLKQQVIRVASLQVDVIHVYATMHNSFFRISHSFIQLVSGTGMSGQLIAPTTA